MQALHDLFQYAIYRHALVTVIAVGTLCSLLSVVVVLKRMAFLGEGISHAGFGGIGTAMFLGLSGWSQELFVVAFCIVAGLLIGALSRKRHVEPDSAIGIVLVAALAWGAFMIDLRKNALGSAWYTRLTGPPQVTTPPEQLLFGSLGSVGVVEMWQAIAVAALVLAVCGLLFKEILFYTFDEPVSRVFGVPTGMIHYLLLGVLSLTIVVVIRVAGFLLGPALLVLPGATALLLSRRLGVVLLIAWVVGMIGAVGGLLVFLEAGTLSTGPCVVGVLCGLFGMAFAAKSVGLGVR